MEYGEKISQLRKTKGVTQAELGAALNVTFQAVSKWERGESYPDFETLSKIAKFFGVPISYFEDGETVATYAPAPAAAPAPAPAPAPVMLGVCSECGQSIYNEDDIAMRQPKLLCKHCLQARLERGKAYTAAQKRSAIFRRNLGLIVSGVISLLFIILGIISIAKNPENVGMSVAGMAIILVFGFTFIAQLFWGGLVVDIVLCGGKLIGGPGVIFTLDLDGIIFLIVFKLIWLVIKIIFFILTIIFFTIVGIVVAPFSFIPSVIKLSKGDELG